MALFLMTAVDATAQDNIKFSTICIDAGHGGKDPGSVSKDGNTYEKTITLSVAQKLGGLITAGCPDVKVVYTRSTDVYLTLDERAKTANRNKANLFLSIHVNAAESSAAHGYSSHILGQSSKQGRDTFAGNLNVCKRENSVIMMEEDYTTKYAGFDPDDPESSILFTLMQNAFYEQSMYMACLANEQMGASKVISTDRGVSQDPFYVLWKTTMPAMLFEMGFISNKDDLAVITTEEGQDKIAEALYQAFLKFKNEYNKSLNYNNTTPSDTEIKIDSTKVSIQGNNEGNRLRFGIQVSTSSRLLSAKDPFFRKNATTIYPSGRNYRYIVGESEDLKEVEELFNRVKSDFPGCFIVRMEGDPVRFYRQ